MHCLRMWLSRRHCKRKNILNEIKNFPLFAFKKQLKIKLITQKRY